MDVVQLSIELLTLLFFVALVAGFLDTLAGGGGLLCIPALILAGLPPLPALATNKLQGSMGTATATLLLIKNKKISWPVIKPLMIMAFIGSVIGTTAVQFINTDVLSFVIPIVLMCIAVYFVISPKPNMQDAEPALSESQFRRFVVPVIGFYDGMFGPGTGSFFALSGVICRRLDIIKATATAKPLNFATNIASLIVFVLAGHIVWTIGLLMMVGQAIGAWCGAHFLYKINPTYLRWVIVTMCTAMLTKYAHSMGWLVI